MRDAISLKHYVDCCIGLDCRHTSAVAGCLKANTQPCQEVASCAVAGTNSMTVWTKRTSALTMTHTSHSKVHMEAPVNVAHGRNGSAFENRVPSNV